MKLSNFDKKKFCQLGHLSNFVSVFRSYWNFTKFIAGLSPLLGETLPKNKYGMSISKRPNTWHTYAWFKSGTQQKMQVDLKNTVYKPKRAKSGHLKNPIPLNFLSSGFHQSLWIEDWKADIVHATLYLSSYVCLKMSLHWLHINCFLRNWLIFGQSKWQHGNLPASILPAKHSRSKDAAGKFFPVKREIYYKFFHSAKWVGRENLAM